MANQWWNTVGLALGMAGVVIIFFFGPPQPSLEEGVPIGLEQATPLPNGKTVGEHNREQRARRAMFSRMSRIGLALVFLGFVLQLVATWS